MKKFSKFKKLLIAISVILCIVITTAYAGSMGNFTKKQAYDSTFTDVKQSDWFEKNVKFVYEYGLMGGNSANTFNPKGNMTIAEAVTFASRLHSIYNNDAHTFDSTTPWYQAYVDYAHSEGIIDKNKFSNYNKAATRTEFVNIIANSVPSSEFAPKNKINAIPDVKEDTASSNIYMFYRAGILTGSDKQGTFNPNSNIQRSEVATIATRIIDKSIRLTFEPSKVEVTGLSIKEKKINANTGDTVTVQATVWPTNAADKTITWWVNDNSIATVNNGVVKCLKAGTVIVYAKAGNITNACTIKVSDVAVTGLSIKEKNLSVKEGKTVNVQATVWPINATNKTITWWVKDTSIAKVDNGVVTGLKAGTTTVYAKAGSITNTCTVAVTGIKWYNEGTYEVGIDIPEGDYYARSTNTSGSGYWCIYKDERKQQIVDNDNFDNFTFLRVKSGQYLRLSNCKITDIEFASAPPIYNGNTYYDGMYRVGIDIPAGEYKFVVSTNSAGYYCIYNDISYEKIVSNENFEIQTYRTVRDGEILEVKRADFFLVNTINKERIYYNGFVGVPDFGKMYDTEAYVDKGDSFQYLESLVGESAQYSYVNLLKAEGFVYKEYVSVVFSSYSTYTNEKLGLKVDVGTLKSPLGNIITIDIEKIK